MESELIKVIQRIAEYNPDKDYLGMIANSDNIWDTLNALRLFYRDNEPQILQLAAHNPRKFYDIFSFDFERFFSPIELFAWRSIRCNSMVLYPQYPALNYILDFANPYFKIGLELDGKEFHEAGKDTIRDQKLYDKEGWKIFRIAGDEALRNIDKPLANNYRPDTFEYLGRYFHNTMEGVLEAINQIYFFTDKKCYDSEDEWIYKTCIETLAQHKLANFSIL